MSDLNEDFCFTVRVNDKELSVDGMLIMAELRLSANAEDSDAHLIAAVRKCVRPADVAQSLTDAEALALGLRIGMRLQTLGKTLAP